ncbi:glutamate-cysteine ligase family protein [Micromonospora soli]|uniref:glutamate-cysteine ligase family protein n=1 Tax=Micromonospora sp. NBRC 110009 TaxID=3061627 RepID=UPI0026737F7E|nr:glutamate-cysteine ligase family protein [Micromonospora sp. NBRC 110009]WKT97739.1 glutamate-cysteine ligase family protein [Micromonospora sp. NBRC 110009]
MDDTAVLTEAIAAAYVGAAAFRIGPPGRVGVELEYLVRDPTHPLDRPSIARLLAAVAHLGDPLPGGGRITVEPGGQVELASSVGATMQDCIDATGTDLALLRAAFAAAGLRLEGTGLDTSRTPRLVTRHPRYVALAAYHDRVGPKGRAIMCNSASVQVCLDAGDDSDGWTGYRRRWWLADALGPVLLAAFANSPHRGRSGARWVSRRQALRFGTDASRTRTPRHTAEPRTAWTRYALAARVAVMAEPEPLPWLVPTGLTMRDWLRGHGPRPATLGDLERHLGTLVPPVRPRGYLEFRMIDQQPGDGWVVPVAVVSALLDDPVAAEAAAAATEHLRSPVRRHGDWLAAARDGLAEPTLARAALACFTAAADALARQGASVEVRRAVADFAETYVARGRCPADDPRAEQSALARS